MINMGCLLGLQLISECHSVGRLEPWFIKQLRKNVDPGLIFCFGWAGQGYAGNSERPTKHQIIVSDVEINENFRTITLKMLGINAQCTYCTMDKTLQVLLVFDALEHKWFGILLLIPWIIAQQGSKTQKTSTPWWKTFFHSLLPDVQRGTRAMFAHRYHREGLTIGVLKRSELR